MANQTIPVGSTYVSVAICDNKYIHLTNTELWRQKKKKKYQVYLAYFYHVQGQYKKRTKHLQI